MRNFTYFNTFIKTLKNKEKWQELQHLMRKI